MKEEYDFSKGERGKFFDPAAEFVLPVYLEQDVEAYLSARAEAKGLEIEDLVNQWIEADAPLPGRDALHRASLWAVVSITGGTLAGLFTVWLMGIIFAAMLRLQRDGTLNIRNAIGQQGTVYLTIPREGSGQASVVVQGSLKVFDAVTENKQKIPTGDKIKVVGIVDNQTLIVTKLTE